MLSRLGVRDRGIGIIVALGAHLLRLDNPTMELGRHPLGLGEMLAEGRGNYGMTGKREGLAFQKGLDHVEHGVVGARGGEIGVGVLQQQARGLKAALCLPQQVLLLNGHTDTPSRRMFLRKGP